MRNQSRFKRVCKGLLLALLIVVCLHIGTTVVLKWAVSNKVAALRRAGEPAYAEDMVGPSVPDAQNGAIELGKAIKALESKSLPPSIAEYIQGYGSEALGGSDSFDDNWWKLTDLELSSARHIVSLIEAGIAKPAVVFADDLYHSRGDYYNYDRKLGRVARFLRLKANCDARNGRMHEAAETILDMITVSRNFLCKASPGGLSRYSRFRWGGMKAVSEALRFGEFSNYDAGRLEEALTITDMNLVLTCQLRETRANMLTGVRDHVPYGCELEGTTDAEARANWVIVQPLVQFVLLRLLGYTDEAIGLCSKSPAPNRSALIALGRRYWRSLFDEGLDESYFKRWDQRQSWFNLTRIAIRTKSFKREHGTYPASLSQLGPSIPTDPVSGKPYSYLRIGKGFAVYGKGDHEWYSVRFRNPTLRQKLDDKVLIGWIFKD